MVPHNNHPEGWFLQPLPSCLTPDAGARLVHPDLPLPHAGDSVVLASGMIYFLEVLDDTRPATRDNTLLWAAGMRGYHVCAGADWRDDLGALDDGDMGLEEGDPESLGAVWDLLLTQANSRASGSTERAAES